jgi:nucleotide-binding universal stress UspA family protein
MDLLLNDFLGKPAWIWLAFVAIVIALLVLDLGVLHRKEHEIGVRESLMMSAIYITLGLAYGGWVWWYLGEASGLAYLTGFVVEKSLAVDNVFVIAMNFAYFAIVTERSFAYGLPEVLADHARLHDLVVSGSEPGGLLSVRALAEHLVFDSGRPAVVVPRAWHGPFRCDRVVVAWDNTRPAARALGDALPLLRSARAVTLVMAGGEKAIDTSLGELDLVAALARRGVSGAAVQRIDQAGGSIGETLAAWARAQDADLLVAGAFGHSRLRQLVLGGVTRSLLDAPRLPVLLSH